MSRLSIMFTGACLLALMLAGFWSTRVGLGWAAPSQAASIHARCKTVTKKVHGHKKKVKVCVHPRATATPVPPPSLFDGPSDVVVNAQGNVLIADQRHRRIVTFSPSGTLLASWTNAGTAPRIFDMLYGIALDRIGNVYVTDAANHLVDKLDSTGKPLVQWSTEVAGAGSFPTLLAVGGNGDLFVPDTGTKSVLHLSSAGTLLGKIGQGQFTNPYAVSIGPDSNLYVTDFGGSRVREYTPTGDAVAEWGSGANGTVHLQAPEAIAVDSQGTIFVTEQAGDIVTFDRAGKVLQDLVSTTTRHFDDPSGIALDAAGDIYVTDFISNRVGKLSPTGDVLATWK